MSMSEFACTDDRTSLHWPQSGRAEGVIARRQRGPVNISMSAGLPGACRQDVADPVANCLVCCAAHWAAAAATGIVGSTNHAASRP